MPSELTGRPLADRRMGFAVLRFLLGINMLGRSVVRMPDIDGFASGMAENFADTILPGPFVYAFGLTVFIVEAIIGAMLILGWKTRWALVTMGLLMCSLTVGMLLLQNFGTVANILLYGTVASLLLFGTRYDYFGIDRGFSWSDAERL